MVGNDLTTDIAVAKAVGIDGILDVYKRQPLHMTQGSIGQWATGVC